MTLSIVDYIAPRDYFGGGSEAEKGINLFVNEKVEPLLKNRGYKLLSWIRGYWKDKEISYVGAEGIVKVLKHIEHGFCPNPAQFGLRVISLVPENELTKLFDREFPALIRTVPELEEFELIKNQ